MNNIGGAFTSGFLGAQKEDEVSDSYDFSMIPSTVNTFAAAFEKSVQSPKGKYTGNTQEEAMRGSVIPTDENYEAIAGKSTKSYEGWRDKIYTDTEGYETIGYGHKLTKDEIASGKYKNGITKEQGEEIYKQDSDRIKASLYKRYPWVDKAPTSVKTAVEDMAFNMGPAWLDKFPKARKALEIGDYEQASNEIVGTKYYSQVGQRAKDNVTRLRASIHSIEDSRKNVNSWFDDEGRLV